jgi:hypothetical protein
MHHLGASESWQISKNFSFDFNGLRGLNRPFGRCVKKFCDQVVNVTRVTRFSNVNTSLLLIQEVTGT